MFRPRVIPVLLLKNQGLVKSIRFKKHRYIGDPINAVRIFNDLKADELVFLDILASHEKRHIPLQFVKEVGEEANMPFVVGGGINSLDIIRDIIKAGAEKVIICSYAVENPDFISHAVREFGSSTITVCLDVKRNLFGREKIYTKGGKVETKLLPLNFAKEMESRGAGEIIVQSINNDGMMLGYDLKLVRKFSESVSIPIIALGGAGKNQDLEDAYNHSYANGLAAGSLFVYHGPKKGVLINYPNIEELKI